MEETNTGKQSFLLGLTIGIAAIATIGFFVMLGMYIKQTSKLAQVSPTQAGTDSNNANNDTNNAANNEPTAPKKIDIAVTDADHIRGKKDAPVTIIEFSDFQCPYCQRYHATMQQVMSAYPDKVRWVYKHFPLESIHPFARKAAEAAECASEQGKFWEYADKLYAGQASFSETFFSDLAREMKLDSNKFDECLANGKYRSVVDADYQQGLAAGVQGTPSNFVNGQELPGAVPFADVKSAIDSL